VDLHDTNIWNGPKGEQVCWSLDTKNTVLRVELQNFSKIGEQYFYPQKIWRNPVTNHFNMWTYYFVTQKHEQVVHLCWTISNDDIYLIEMTSMKI
jgi:hypothetical protein